MKYEIGVPVKKMKIKTMRENFKDLSRRTIFAYHSCIGNHFAQGLTTSHFKEKII